MSSVHSLRKLVATLSEPANGNLPDISTTVISTLNCENQDRRSNDMMESTNVTLVTLSCLEDNGTKKQDKSRSIDRNRWKRNNKQKSNDLERVRRERITQKIKKLGALIPVSDALKKNKESILEQAMVYISDLQGRLKSILSPEGSAAQVKLAQELQLQVNQLKEEKKCYQAILESHGISSVVNPAEFWRRIGMSQSSSQQNTALHHTSTSNNNFSADTQSSVESTELNSSANYTAHSVTSLASISTSLSQPTVSSMNSVTEITSFSSWENDDFLENLRSLSLTNNTAVKQTACCRLTWSLPNVNIGFSQGNTDNIDKLSDTLVDVHTHTIASNPSDVNENSEVDDRLTKGISYPYVKPSKLKILSSVNHSSANLGKTANTASCSVMTVNSLPPFSVVALLPEPLKSIKKPTDPCISTNNLFLTAKASDKGNAFKTGSAQFPKSNIAFLHSANGKRLLTSKSVLSTPSSSQLSTLAVSDSISSLKIWLNSKEQHGDAEEELRTKLSTNEKLSMYTTASYQTSIEASDSVGNALIYQKPATSHTTPFDIASLVQEKDNSKETDVSKFVQAHLISNSDRNDINHSTASGKSVAATNVFWSTSIASTSFQTEQGLSSFGTLTSASALNCIPSGCIDMKQNSKPVQTNMLLIADILDKKSDLINDHANCQTPSNLQTSLFVPDQPRTHSFSLLEHKLQTSEYINNKNPALNTPLADVSGFSPDLDSSHSLWQPVIPGTTCSEYVGQVTTSSCNSHYMLTGSKTRNAVINSSWNENFLIGSNSNPCPTNNQCMYRENVATNLLNRQADTQGLQRKRKVERKGGIQKRTKVQEKYLNTTLWSVPNLLTSTQLTSWNTPSCNQQPSINTGNPNVKNYRNIWSNVEIVREPRSNFTNTICSTENSQQTSHHHSKVDGSTSTSVVSNVLYRNKTRTLSSHEDQSNHTYFMNHIVNSDQSDYSTSNKMPKVHPGSYGSLPYSGMLYENTVPSTNIYISTTFATSPATVSLKHWQQPPDPRHQKELWNMPPCHDAAQTKSQFVHAGTRCNVSLPQNAHATNSYHVLRNHPTYPAFSQHISDFDKTIYSSYGTSIMSSAVTDQTCFTHLSLVTRAPTKNFNNNNSTCATEIPYGQGGGMPMLHGLGLQQKRRNEKKVLHHQISQILGDTVPAQSQAMHLKSQQTHTNS